MHLCSSKGKGKKRSETLQHLSVAMHRANFDDLYNISCTLADYVTHVSCVESHKVMPPIVSKSRAALFDTRA